LRSRETQNVITAAAEAVAGSAGGGRRKERMNIQKREGEEARDRHGRRYREDTNADPEGRVTLIEGDGSQHWGQQDPRGTQE